MDELIEQVSLYCVGDNPDLALVFKTKSDEDANCVYAHLQGANIKLIAKDGLLSLLIGLDGIPPFIKETNIPIDKNKLIFEGQQPFENGFIPIRVSYPLHNGAVQHTPEMVAPVQLLQK